MLFCEIESTAFEVKLWTQRNLTWSFI